MCLLSPVAPRQVPCEPLILGGWVLSVWAGKSANCKVSKKEGQGHVAPGEHAPSFPLRIPEPFLWLPMGQEKPRAVLMVQGLHPTPS